MQGTVLVIDDSTSVRSQIIQTLQVAHLFATYFEAEDGIAAFQQLQEIRVDLILCDLEMPRMDGFKFLALMQSRDDLKAIPVILLTGREDRDLKVKGLEQGAVDYVTKPFDAGELVARVKVQQKIKALQDELRSKNEMLKNLAITDVLTGLYNRRFLMENLEMEFQRMQRKEGVLSLVLIDIDHFKKVNDTFGHQQGDVVLTLLAEATRKSLRSYDVAARYGGEEFVLLLPETTLAQGIIVAERLRRGVEGMKLAPPMERETLTISLGVSSYPGRDIDSVESLIKAADDALYRAKEKGRNRIEVMTGGL
jgi:diguanylate cyclase (GGDEF)-like protein